jgi:hypothetical protein
MKGSGKGARPSVSSPSYGELHWNPYISVISVPFARLRPLHGLIEKRSRKHRKVKSVIESYWPLKRLAVAGKPCELRPRPPSSVSERPFVRSPEPDWSGRRRHSRGYSLASVRRSSPSARSLEIARIMKSAGTQA